jgi:hypothetical protein
MIPQVRDVILWRFLFRAWKRLPGGAEDGTKSLHPVP